MKVYIIWAWFRGDNHLSKEAYEIYLNKSEAFERIRELRQGNDYFSFAVEEKTISGSIS